VLVGALSLIACTGDIADTLSAGAGGGSAESTSTGSPASSTSSGTPPDGGVTPPCDDCYGLPSDRTTLWQPGVTYNGGIPNRTTICATLSPSGGDDTAAIQKALDACPDGQVVFLN